jgi:hypothetical protein
MKFTSEKEKKFLLIYTAENLMRIEKFPRRENKYVHESTHQRMVLEREKMCG